jgi:hypothetical protein
MRVRRLGSSAWFLIVAAACSSSEPPPRESAACAADEPRPADGASEPGPRGAPASGETSGTATGPSTPAPVPYEHFDVNHILSTGQSNAVANDGKPVLSTTQPYDNLMFDSGVMTGGSCDTNGCSRYQKPTSLVPLVEGDTFFSPIETMSSGLANEATRLARASSAAGSPIARHDVLVSLHGRSGNGYWCLRKGGCDWWPGHGYIKPFDEGMMQVTDAFVLAKAAGKTYVVRAVTAIHGEHDHYGGEGYFPLPGTDGTSTVPDYGHGLEEWQRDYESGIRAITGQSLPVPLLVSQYSHWNDQPTTKIAYEQLAAHLRSRGKVVVIGPTYALPYTSACLHFTSDGERQLGEYFAKAYARIVVDGLSWEPLRPLSITLEGNVVTARFLVPKPPLVLDTTRVSNPGNFGFEMVDDSGRTPAITSVELAGPDAVTITLAAPPTGAAKRLRYAYTFHGCGGSGTIARGNLRDSDETPSEAGYDLFNWAVHFDEPIAE